MSTTFEEELETDPLRTLCRLIDEAGLTVTFSINCVSGCLPGGRSECQCWRCRGVDHTDEDPGWKDEAAKATARSLENLRLDIDAAISDTVSE